MEYEREQGGVLSCFVNKIQLMSPSRSLVACVAGVRRGGGRGGGELSTINWIMTSQNKLTQYCKDEGVGEVSVEWEFHQVPSDAKGSCGLNQRHEDPPADRSIQNSERDTGDQLLFTRVRFGLKMIQRNKYLLILTYAYHVSGVSSRAIHQALGKLTSFEDDFARLVWLRRVFLINN